MNSDVLDAKTTLEAVLTGTAEGVFVLDSGFRCVFFSRASERITGYSAAEMLGADCRCAGPAESAVQADRLPPGTICPDLSALQGEADALRKPMRIRRKDGSTIRVQGHYIALRDERGGFNGVLGLLRALPARGLDEAQLHTICENLPAEVKRLCIAAADTYGFADVISTSSIMREPLERIRASCEHPGTVLLIGEMGTGKERVARTIHAHTPRRGSRFVTVHCAAQKERLDQELFGNGGFDGLIRVADSGTLYLEEIGEMPPGTQAGLLHVLQSRHVRPVSSSRECPVDARVIVSSRQPLGDAVSGGRFRDDLYQQLSVITIHLPPLRERIEDIPFLVQQRLADLNAQSAHRRIEKVHAEVWPWLLRYSWPGNIRELNGAIESAFAIGSGAELIADDLPHLIRGELVELDDAADRLDQPLDDVLASVERRAILTALHRSEGRRSQAAREMGISRSRLYRRMEALGIHPREDV